MKTSGRHSVSSDTFDTAEVLAGPNTFSINKTCLVLYLFRDDKNFDRIMTSVLIVTWM